MGVLLRRLQGGDLLDLPHSRPTRAIGKGCHELRVADEGASWRLIYRIGPDAIVIIEVFRKATRTTPTSVIEACKRRLRAYGAAAREQG